MSKELEFIKKYPYTNEFIKKNKLSDEFIEENKMKIIDILKSRKKCEGCKGLNNCKQISTGERLGLSYDGIIKNDVEYCDYALIKIKEQNLAKSYLYCDVPERLLGITLENINYLQEQEQLYLKLAAILKNKSKKGLFITGGLGVGKTYLAVALANSLVKNGSKVAFVKVATFFNDMKAFIGTRSEMIDITINKLKRAEYLFFDDIGSESVSEFVRDDILLRILDHRMENNLITIFTSNMNKEELLKHYTHDRNDKSNSMKAERLLERIDILTESFVLLGKDLRRK